MSGTYNFYRPQTKLRKGNVFTSMCQEFCPRGVRQTLPWQAETPFPRADTQRSWQADTPLGRYPPRWLLQQMVRILLDCILVFNVVSVLNLFLNDTKNGDVDGACKRSLRIPSTQTKSERNSLMITASVINTRVCVWNVGETNIYGTLLVSVLFLFQLASLSRSF